MSMLSFVFLLFFLSGEELFKQQCAGCHGSEATGTAKAPGLANNPRVAEQSIDQLSAFIATGNIAAGMPGFSDLPAQDRRSIANYLTVLNMGTVTGSITSAEAVQPLKWGEPKAGDWLTYNGDLSANRYSPLTQINRSNVAGLRLKWVFPLESFGLETTPLASDGVLYITGPNQVFALDALTGTALWHYSRPATPGLADDARLGTNRGVAILAGQVFFVTDNAHLLSLDRGNGRLLWERTLATKPLKYGGTLAPLVADGKIVVGVSGADAGIRGFIAAFRPTGEQVWRVWTVPAKGEPGIETWKGAEPEIGGGSTWLTGSYDPASHTLYWPTGNPYPGFDDHDRAGDNLYTDCILALDVATGAMKWHYQFTPHDVADRDATEPMVLVDAVYAGAPRKLILHADRNGFFYVLDRTNGKLLLSKPFLRRVDWASSIGSDGRPVVVNKHGCPIDAANWQATAYNPETRLYYFMALEECTGEPTAYPNQTGQRFLRALNIDTGKVEWEVPQPGPARSKTGAGALATAGGLVFYGQPNGGFAAVDARSGKELWQVPTNIRMKASPMTFSLNGAQYVAVAAGPNILCFGL